MNFNLVTNAIAILIITAATAMYMSQRTAELDNTAQQNSVRSIDVKKTEKRTNENRSGSTVTIYKDKQNGHFWTYARVNSGRVHFLVDTGASSVVLTLNDAKKSGVKIRDLEFNIPVSTAGGTNYGAHIKLKNIAVGAIALRDIDAIIIKEGLETSLLGMSYLGELQKVEATRDRLFLRL